MQTTSIPQNSTCCRSHLELKVMLNVQLEGVVGQELAGATSQISRMF